MATCALDRAATADELIAHYRALVAGLLRHTEVLCEQTAHAVRDFENANPAAWTILQQIMLAQSLESERLARPWTTAMGS
jgi:hypothetical protein